MFLSRKNCNKWMNFERYGLTCNWLTGCIILYCRSSGYRVFLTFLYQQRTFRRASVCSDSTHSVDSQEPWKHEVIYSTESQEPWKPNLTHLQTDRNSRNQKLTFCRQPRAIKTLSHTSRSNMKKSYILMRVVSHENVKSLLYRQVRTVETRS